MNLSKINLTLFFTRGISLKKWAEVGNLEREVAIYHRLTEYLNTVNFITYGGRQDRQYKHYLKGINLYSTIWTESIMLNIAFLLAQHWPTLMRTDVLKTNQIRGSEIPIWFKRYFGKKLIVRCGYLIGRFSEQNKQDVKTINAIQSYECEAFKSADIGIVATIHDRDWIIKTYGISKQKLRVIPNYVDIDNFYPPNIQSANYKRYLKFDIVFVGRSSPQKNLPALLNALALLKDSYKNMRLLLIGSCGQDENLRKMAEEARLNITFLNNVPNSQIFSYLLESSLFILPSLYEGHPKVLIEAMSCGMPCIGTEVEGIKELIVHRETGYLCKTDAQSLADAIRVVLSDEALSRKISENARQYVMENYALEKILKMELDVIEEVVAS